MKILGIGIDITQNKRIKKLTNKKIFLKRTFGKNELKFSNKTINKTNYFAKRFAAKEAFAKSLGTGFRNNLNLKDIEILNDKIGKPYYLMTNKINSMIKKNLKLKILICFFQFLTKKIIQ